MKKLNAFIAVGLVSLFSFSARAQEQTVPEPDPKPIAEEPAEKPLREKIGETAEGAYEGAKKAVDKANQELKQARQNRGGTSWTVLGSLSAIDTWIPLKLGVSLVYSPDASGSWELEYLRGKISYGTLIEDIGSFTDQRFSFFRRSFSQRNSFSFLYGLYYNSLSATLGSEYLATISGSAEIYETVKVETMGLTWGIGNRWQTTGGFVWSFDWFVVNVPLVVLESDASFLQASSSESQKEDVRDALKVFEDYPTFAIVKMQLGMSF